MNIARLIVLASALAFADSIRAQAAPVTNAAPLDDPTMQRLYDEVKTPFKYGVVLRGDSTNQMVD